MNGIGSEPEPVVEDIDDAAESDDLEMDEAIDTEGAEFLPLPFPPFLPSPFGGGSSRRANVARGRSYFASRPQTMFVTQTQLQSALTKVRNDVAKNGRAIAAVNTRVNGVQTTITRQGQQIAAQAKTNVRQARDIALVRAEVKTGLKKAQENGLLLFLLTRPKATSVATTADTLVGAAASGTTVPSGHKILIQPDKDNSLLLALALSGGLGGNGSDGGSNMLFLALAFSGGL